MYFGFGHNNRTNQIWLRLPPNSTFGRACETRHDITFSEVAGTDDDVEKGSAGTVTCVISGITEQVTVVFSDGSDDISTVTEVTTVDQGSYASDTNTQTATLVVNNVQADASYTCTVTSGQYSDSAGHATVVSIKMFGT